MQQLLQQLAYYFPYYVALVLAPMAIRTIVEKSIGIDEEFGYASIDYETAFRTVVVSSLFYPLFEELLFRGLPYMFWGPLGAIVGSIVWVLMHPAWQLQLLSYETPLWKKIAFTATTIFYYASSAAFYTMMWVEGAGLAAVIYHMLHNGWLTLTSIIREKIEELRLRRESRPVFVRRTFVRKLKS